MKCIASASTHFRGDAIAKLTHSQAQPSHRCEGERSTDPKLGQDNENNVSEIHDQARKLRLKGISTPIEMRECDHGSSLK